MFADSSKQKGWGALEAVGLGFLAYKIPSWVLGELIPFINPILPHAGNERSFILYMLFETAIISAVYLLVRLYGMRLADIGLGGIKISYAVKAVAAFCSYFILSVMVAWLISFFITVPDQPQEIGFDPPAGLYQQLLVFFALVVIVPVAEEVLFRGFLFTGVRRDFSFFVTSLVVSVLFGLVHGQLDVGIDVFVLSLVLCYLREKTGSLWPGIFVHAIKNSVAFFTVFIYNVH